MASKAPWREVIMDGDTGRFTREQIRDAVEAVKSRREARSSRPKAAPKTRAGSRSRTSGSSVKGAKAGRTPSSPARRSGKSKRTAGSGGQSR